MFTYLIIIAFIALIGGIVYYQKIYKKSLKIKSPYDVAHKAKILYTTPDGARIGSQGDEELSDQTLAAIDTGIRSNLSRLERLHPEYYWKFEPSDFKIVLLDAELSESGLPAFKVPIPKDSPYINTEYRKGTKENPYVLAAGLMVAVGQPYGNIIAVPKPVTNNWVHLSEGVDFEIEHIQAAYNDPDLFRATEHHTNGGHPIYPETFSFRLVKTEKSRDLLPVCITGETLIGDLTK